MSRMLILSFSPIAGDARVLKQVHEFARDHEVITCGYGPAPEGVSEHIRIPDDQPINQLSGRLITLRWYRRVYWSMAAVRFAREALRGRSFDVIIADDVEAVPLALTVPATHGVLADLHEYSPRLHEENPAWMRRIAPYWSWLTRRYVTRANAWTTVSGGLAVEYEKQFGFRAEIVTNAAPFQELEPSEVHEPLRLVHSGACLRNRHLEQTVRGAVDSPAVEMDLYLTPNDPGHLAELRAIAAESDGRVRVMDPVPYGDLVRTLNEYDVGVFLLEPVNFSLRWALPNKLFDFVQARLGVLIGPSPEMERYVRDYDLGIVAAGNDAAALQRALAGLTADQVRAFKQSSAAHARELSSETQVAIWRRLITQLEGTRA